jgi:hypothetical protein
VNMAVINDLTWQQLQDALGIAGAITVTSEKVLIDVSLIADATIDSLSDKGVLKFLDKLLDACQEAQTTVNAAQAAGERLAAFSPPTIGAPSSTGLVPVTRTVGFRYVLDSATSIQGPNN